MKNKTYFSPFIHYSIYLIASFLFAYNLDMSMVDDGLRHIAFSANPDLMKNWGTVFPYSLFGDYDPWFLWHKLISLFLYVVDYSQVHVLINTVVLFLLSILLDTHLKANTNFNFASLSYIFILSIVFFSSFKYLTVRPDLLSGLYVLFALLLRNKFIPIFILTIIYGPFYYLFFIYTGSIGIVYLIQKKIKAFLGVLVGSVFVLFFHLMYDLNGYIETIINILTDQKLRMGLEVGEGMPLFSIFANVNYFILLPLFFVLCFILIYKYNSFFTKNNLALFLLVTSILWVNQIRYLQLFYPMIILFMFIYFININKKKFLEKTRLYYIFMKKYASYSKRATLFYIIAIPYTIVVLAYVYNEKSLNKEITEAAFFKNEVFKNKIILLNRLNLDIYKGLYNNPTIKFVPSCSVGWFEEKNGKMKDIYVRMQEEEGISENELYSLIKYVNADFYIHYLKNKEQVLDFDKLNELGIKPEIIYNNRIIFKVKKEENL